MAQNRLCSVKRVELSASGKERRMEGSRRVRTNRRDELLSMERSRCFPKSDFDALQRRIEDVESYLRQRCSACSSDVQVTEADEAMLLVVSRGLFAHLSTAANLEVGIESADGVSMAEMSHVSSRLEELGAFGFAASTVHATLLQPETRSRHVSAGCRSLEVMVALHDILIFRHFTFPLTTVYASTATVAEGVLQVGLVWAKWLSHEHRSEDESGHDQDCPEVIFAVVRCLQRLFRRPSCCWDSVQPTTIRTLLIPFLLAALYWCPTTVSRLIAQLCASVQKRLREETRGARWHDCVSALSTLAAMSLHIIHLGGDKLTHDCVYYCLISVNQCSASCWDELAATFQHHADNEEGVASSHAAAAASEMMLPVMTGWWPKVCSVVLETDDIDVAEEFLRLVRDFRDIAFQWEGMHLLLRRVFCDFKALRSMTLEASGVKLLLGDNTFFLTEVVPHFKSSTVRRLPFLRFLLAVCNEDIVLGREILNDDALDFVTCDLGEEQTDEERETLDALLDLLHPTEDGAFWDDPGAFMENGEIATVFSF